MRINILKKSEVGKFLKRLKSPATEIGGPGLDSVLVEILRKAYEFVPSAAGSILLDDPVKKSEHVGSPEKNVLHFVACFGPGSKKLLGMKLPVTVGITGKTYLSGGPYISKDTAADKAFHREIDTLLGRNTRSVLCTPIHIGDSICGVIELVNCKARANYTDEELKLLEIFAGYTSTLIQNALDANRNRELTRLDNLTGLHNDRFFYSQLTTELKKAKRTKRHVSLLFIDLDNFKLINDTLGHLVGSRTLADVGALIRDTLADENAHIVRYGGDEFTVILPGRDKGQAVQVAREVCAAVREAVYLKEKGPAGQPAQNIKGIISCSIGVSSFFEDKQSGRTLEEEKISLIRLADQAMYRAKAKGKDQVCPA